MKTVGDQVEKIRSKNAGPFWLTVDVFCGTQDVYEKMVGELTVDRIAALYEVSSHSIKYFKLPDLFVIKFSFSREIIQGAVGDRDMHGAQMGVLLAEMTLE